MVASNKTKKRTWGQYIRSTLAGAMAFVPPFIATSTVASDAFAFTAPAQSDVTAKPTNTVKPAKPAKPAKPHTKTTAPVKEPDMTPATISADWFVAMAGPQYVDINRLTLYYLDANGNYLAQPATGLQTVEVQDPAAQNITRQYMNLPTNGKIAFVTNPVNSTVNFVGDQIAKFLKQIPGMPSTEEDTSYIKMLDGYTWKYGQFADGAPRYSPVFYDTRNGHIMLPTQTPAHEHYNFKDHTGIFSPQEIRFLTPHRGGAIAETRLISFNADGTKEAPISLTDNLIPAPIPGELEKAMVNDGVSPQEAARIVAQIKTNLTRDEGFSFDGPPASFKAQRTPEQSPGPSLLQADAEPIASLNYINEVRDINVPNRPFSPEEVRNPISYVRNIDAERRAILKQRQQEQQAAIPVPVAKPGEAGTTAGSQQQQAEQIAQAAINDATKAREEAAAKRDAEAAQAGQAAVTTQQDTASAAAQPGSNADKINGALSLLETLGAVAAFGAVLHVIKKLRGKMKGVNTPKATAAKKIKGKRNKNLIEQKKQELLAMAEEWLAAQDELLAQKNPEAAKPAAEASAEPIKAEPAKEQPVAKPLDENIPPSEEQEPKALPAPTQSEVVDAEVVKTEAAEGEVIEQAPAVAEQETNVIALPDLSAEKLKEKVQPAVTDKAATNTVAVSGDYEEQVLAYVLKMNELAQNGQEAPVGEKGAEQAARLVTVLSSWDRKAFAARAKEAKNHKVKRGSFAHKTTARLTLG